MTGRTINVDTRFDADVIESSISGPDVMGEVVRGVIKLQDQGVRDALKALGWSDPRETADLLAIAQGQRERLAALDNAPRWSRHSERCGVAAALGVTTDRVDLDSVVYAVVKKLMDMRGGAAILSIELQEWMGKWPHQAASRR